VQIGNDYLKLDVIETN